MGSRDKMIVAAALVSGVAALIIITGVVGQGGVRHAVLYYPEKVEQTVAFRDHNGTVEIAGIGGTREAGNPTLIMRTSFAYVLTVVNQGERHHRLYIDGFDVQTDLLEPGRNDTITIFPGEEGTWNYYDKRERLNLLGQIRAVQVVASDGFEGIWRDLI